MRQNSLDTGICSRSSQGYFRRHDRKDIVKEHGVKGHENTFMQLLVYVASEETQLHVVICLNGPLCLNIILEAAVKLFMF